MEMLQFHATYNNLRENGMNLSNFYGPLVFLKGT